MVPAGATRRRRSGCAPWNTFDGWPMETPLPPDFKEFLALLNSEKIEYLIVGGYAVSYRGYPHLNRVSMHPDSK